MKRNIGLTTLALIVRLVLLEAQVYAHAEMQMG